MVGWKLFWIVYPCDRAIDVGIKMLLRNVTDGTGPQLELFSALFQHHAGAVVWSETQWLFSTVKLRIASGAGAADTQFPGPLSKVLL
jgi:hypothetical protein